MAWKFYDTNGNLKTTDSDGSMVVGGATSPLTTKGDLWGYNTADARIPVGSDGTILVADSNDAEGVRWGNHPQIAVISDTKTQNTSGGTFTSGAWQTRDLNTEDDDPDGLVTISSNQFTLIAGEYRISWRAPAYTCDRHQSRLYDVTNTTPVRYGKSMLAAAAAPVANVSEGSARVNIATATTYRIEHRCESTKATVGLGIASNFANEVYTTVEIIRLGANV